MTARSIIAIALVYVFVATPAAAESQRYLVSSSGQPLTRAALSAFHSDTGELANPAQAKRLIRQTLLPDSEEGAAIRDAVIIHVLKWSPLPAVGGKRDIESQHWYVFRDDAVVPWSHEDFTERNRLVGVRRVFFMFVHLNVQRADYTATYDIRVVKRPSLAFKKLLQAASLFVPFGGSEETLEAGTEIDAVWAGGELERIYRPSDIQVGLRIAGTDANASRSFSNESLTYWDVGVGFPIKRLNNLVQTATGTMTDEDSLYALLSVFPVGRDSDRPALSLMPTPIVGLQINEDPTRRILVALGWGTSPQIFAGVLWIKPPTEAIGPRPYKAEFTFGVSLGLRTTRAQLRD